MYGMTSNHESDALTYDAEWAIMLRTIREATGGQWFRTNDITEMIKSATVLPAEIEYSRDTRTGEGFAKSIGRYLTGKAGRTFEGLMITSRSSGGKHGRLYKIEKVS